MTSPSPSPSKWQTLLALDYGTKRIGLAVGNTRTQTCQALPPLTNINGKVDLEQLETVIKQWRIKKIVLGLPLNQDGEETAMSTKIKQIGALITKKTLVPVVFADERYSSIEADRLMRAGLEAGKRLKKNKLLMRDSLAAQLIMQAYFAQN